MKFPKILAKNLKSNFLSSMVPKFLNYCQLVLLPSGVITVVQKKWYLRDRLIFNFARQHRILCEFKKSLPFLLYVMKGTHVQNYIFFVKIIAFFVKITAFFVDCTFFWNASLFELRYDELRPCNFV